MMMLAKILLEWLDIDPGERPEFWEYVVEAWGYRKYWFDKIEIDKMDELIQFYSMNEATKEQFLFSVAYLVMKGK
jgi:hypothetical protein